MTASSRPAWTGYAAALGVVLIWTGFILISRWGGKSALTGYDVLALRLGTAAVLLLPFCRDLPLSVWRDRRLWTLAGLGGVLYGVLVYTAFKFAPAAHGGILLPGMQPFLVTALLWGWLGERPPRSRLVGLSAIAVGVLCVAWPLLQAGDGRTLPGDALMLAASLTWAVYSVLVRRWAFSPWTLTRFVALGSALVYLPVYALWLPKGLTEVSTTQLVVQGLYQGIGPTIIAMWLFLLAVSQLGPARTGALIGLVPVLAGLAAVPLLGEPLTASLLIGLCAVSAGAWYAARPVKAA